MATGVRFGNPASILLSPGAYSLVDASNLNFSPPFAWGLPCIMGAALGGEPMKPYLFNDPIQAEQLFGAGTPLSDAVRFAFMGGVNGGAAAVIAMRIDNAAQAYGSLAAANGGAGLSGNFKDYGGYGNTFSISFYPASVQGTLAVIQGTNLDGTPYLQKIDNEPSFSTLIERINNESPVQIAIASGGTSASQTLQIATSQVDGRATLTDGQGVARSTQAYCYQYPSSMLVNTTDSMLVTYNGAASWAIDSVNASTEVFTTGAASTLAGGNYVKLTGATLPPEIDPAISYIIREALTSTTFTLAQPVTTIEEWAVGTVNATSNVFTAAGNTLANGDVVQLTGTTLNPEITANRNYFVIGKSVDDFSVALTVGGVAIDLTGATAGVKVRKVAGGLLAASGSVSGARVVLQLGGASAITASTPSDFNGIRASVRTVDGYTQVASSASVTAAAYSSDSARITLQGSETWGHLNKQALPGAIFEITGGVYAGTYQILHHEWDGLSIDKVRVVRKLSGDRKIAPGSLSASLVYWTSFSFGRLQPPTQALETQLPANGILTTGGQYLTVVGGDKTVYYATLQGDTVETTAVEVARLINQDTTFPMVASAAYNSGTYTATLTLVAKKTGIVPNGFPVSILVNVQTTLLVSAGGTRLQGGVEPNPPRTSAGVTSGNLLLTNGFDSAPTYQRWLDGLEAIKYIPVYWLVPAGTDNIGVQIAFADHCALMSSTPKRRERRAILGHGLGWTSTAIQTRAELFQSERVVFVSPGFTSSDGITGSPRQYPSTYTAALVAGALVAEGNGISDPITHTYLKNLISLERTYQPGSVELDNMISSGVLTIERDPSITRLSRGYRVTRGITTWRVTTNSALKSNAFESISIISQSDYIAAVIREMEESLFIGTGIFPETLDAVRLAINSELLRRSREKVIYGFDPAFTQVTLNRDSPNALDAAYKIYPVPALEFILNTQLLAPIPVT